MTLVLSVLSRDSIWLVADRRLSYGRGRAAKDDAVKVMSLETRDGVGVLAYAGLGATPRGTEPSTWMSAALRGREDMTFEQALGVLSAVANKELPRYLAGLPGGHTIVAPAFIRGVGSRVYSIDNVIDPKTREHKHRYTSHQVLDGPTSPSIRLSLAGSGGAYLAHRARHWRRALHGLANAHDRGKISDHVISDRLAQLNYEAHLNVRDGTVGPRCIVVWRRRPGARSRSGGGHQFYTGVDREHDTGSFPVVANGMDVQAMADVFMTMMQANLAKPGVSLMDAIDLDADELDRRLRELPSTPDEKLR